MAKLGDFIAFRAAMELIRSTGRQSLIDEVYHLAMEELKKPVSDMRNLVQEIYRPFSAADISERISAMLKSEDITSEVHIVFQSIESLHEACPGHTGDWYFTGDYPTPGGNKVANQSYINYIEGRDVRAY
jgi:amidophosphoribosyltransferase